jgi:fermentation-respiration switch protein FrsA (DUF1100 family)
MLPRLPEWWIFSLALIRIGAIQCPSPTLLTPPDIKQRINAGKFKMVITDNENAPKFDPATDERAIWFEQQTFEKYTITNPKGFTLAAHLLRAENPSDVYVFASHGYRNHGRGEFNVMAKFYHDKGFNVFMIDHQAAGESDGTYIGFGYHESRDGMLWLEFMKKTFGDDIQIILHGISMGSATVMLMTGNENLPENVKFTVADCGYTSAWDEFAHNYKNMHVPTFPVLNAANFFNRLISGFDLKDTNTKEAVAKAKIPMLFVHGGKDDFVPTSMGSQLYAFCGSEHKELYIAPTAAHAESYPFHSDEYESRINAFADKYINR